MAMQVAKNLIVFEISLVPFPRATKWPALVCGWTGLLSVKSFSVGAVDSCCG